MKLTIHLFSLFTTLVFQSIALAFQPIEYSHPDLVVDLGVGLWAWPMPMDWDNDGDLDLVVSCPDVPHQGVYFFENTGNDSKLPLFRAGRRVGGRLTNVQVSYVDGQPRVLQGRDPNNTTCVEYVRFLGRQFEDTKLIVQPGIEVGNGRVRANQWKYVDFDGDGALDLIHGVGYWGDYGWDNAFDVQGRWQRGPLHGYVYILRNEGSSDDPSYAAPYRLQADGKDVDLYGMPSPNFADFDDDGDLDLMCGEFLDRFTYFQNLGSRDQPRYNRGVYLTNAGKKIAMHVQMITPVAVDWDNDGDVDLICGDEDGRVAFVEHTGALIDGLPQFAQPQYFQQIAHDVKFGALATPISIDWDNDGDEDLISGNTAGNIGFIENLDGGAPPKWAAPVLLSAGGKTIHIQAGPNGSIQGPCEAKWGYTVPTVADWDHDGLLDIISNDIWGKILWYRNIGTPGAPELASASPILVEYDDAPAKPAWNWWDPKPKQLVTQWRTSPCVVDWNEDGHNDLVTLDHEGYLVLFARELHDGQRVLLPGKRVFVGGEYDSKHRQTGSGKFLRLNSQPAGGSGRRKFCFTDWDGDGDRDLLVNSSNVNLLENVGREQGNTVFVDRGSLSSKRLAGHTTCPTTVDWEQDGVPDLLAGAEDGRFYFLRNPREASR